MMRNSHVVVEGCDVVGLEWVEIGHGVKGRDSIFFNDGVYIPPFFAAEI